MASIVSAGTTSATALNMSADTTGILQLASNNGTVGLTIDTSQNVGINNSSPTIRTKLMVSSSNASDTVTVGTVSGGFSITNTNSAYGLQFGSLSTGNSWIQSARMDGTATAYNLLLQPGGGNVGIAESSPNFDLHISTGSSASITQPTAGSYGLYIQQNSSGSVGGIYIQDGASNTGNSIFVADNNGVGRLVLDGNGTLFLGTTSGSGASEILSVLQNNNNWMVTFRNSSASAPYGLQVWYTGADPNDTAKEFLGLYGGGTQIMRMTVRSNGGIANYSANNVNLSDRREKTNFAPAGDYLAKVCAIPVQTFNYIDQNMEEDGGLTLGVIAQDVQAVAPELVSESNWANKNAEPKMRLSIYQTDLQYALMKAIQELNAKVTSLEEQVLNLGVK
jgi:polyhydroxyalkanoate synthesis regulator phasin